MDEPPPPCLRCPGTLLHPAQLLESADLLSLGGHLLGEAGPFGFGGDFLDRAGELSEALLVSMPCSLRPPSLEEDPSPPRPCSREPLACFRSTPRGFLHLSGDLGPTEVHVAGVRGDLLELVPASEGLARLPDHVVGVYTSAPL